MKKKIRLVEYFPKVEHSYGKYYAYNSETGESAIFNDEKQLLFYDHFSPGGELDLHPTHRNKISFLNWEHDDLLPIGWSDATTHEPIKFGLYNFKTKSYVLPMNKYNISYICSFNNDSTIFFKTENTLFIIDENGNLIGKLSNCIHFETNFYDSESKTVIVCKAFREEKYKYGVYSCKEKKMIIPTEFDKIQHKHTAGFIVTKNNKMGIYSYEGKVLTELSSHYIEPISKEYKTPFAKTLVKISDQSHNVGIFTLDHQCIVPMEYKAIYYHSDEFFVVQSHNLSWTVYSVPKRKPLVPPCIGVKIGKTILATKYLELIGHSEYYVEKESSPDPTWKTTYDYQEKIPSHYNYHICYDVYSTDGELIKQDVLDTISSSRFCNPYNDSCVLSSFYETR